MLRRAANPRLLAGKAAEHRQVAVGGDHQQGQWADIVQQTGQIGFLVVSVAQSARQFARGDGDAQGMEPEVTQIELALALEAAEPFHDRLIQRDPAHRSGTQHGQALVQILQRAAGSVIR